MGKSIARGCKKSLVDQCYEGLMMKKLEIVLKREMNVMCEVKTGSILRSGLWDHMTNFKWQSVIDEMKLHTRTLWNPEFLHFNQESEEQQKCHYRYLYFHSVEISVSSHEFGTKNHYVASIWKPLWETGKYSMCADKKK